jgi:hypothetical protein
MVIQSDHKKQIIKFYLSGKSPTDISTMFNYKRTTIKEFIRREGHLRTQSEASTLAIIKGKKNNFLAVGPQVRERNRFNPKKHPWSGTPTQHPRYKKDRTQIKAKRCFMEERYFMQEVIKERSYQCELTNNYGKLSVHHIKPVWCYPNLIFNKDNVIVILNKIHKHFHKNYGPKATEENWNDYVQKGGYYSVL